MRIVVLLFIAGLAGCLADEGTPDPVTAPDTQDMTAPLFRPALDLGTVSRPGAAGTSCTDSADDGDCGLGEPSIEVDGAGTIYVTGVCCITVPPPIYVSRDGGASFDELTTPGGIREGGQGIEGDFAIDAEGRMYFADIDLAATFQVTAWEADGTFIRHVRWPGPPLVDRDWIRAEGDGIVYYIYNTGTDTIVYKSTDAAMTWTPTSIYGTGYALGNAAIWPEHALCIVGGNDAGNEVADCSTDGGATWTKETTASPNGGNLAAPTFDEAGNLYVVTDGEGITYSWRPDPSQDGDWTRGPVLSGNGTHTLPWAAAGSDGSLVAAWYGTNDTEIGPDTKWFLWTSIVRNATTAPEVHTMIADPDPVFVGQLGRDLLDFLQVDLAPDGAIHIAYSRQTGPYSEDQDGNEERLQYVRSEALPDIAMTEFWYGP